MGANHAGEAKRKRAKVRKKAEAGKQRKQAAASQGGVKA